MCADTLVQCIQAANALARAAVLWVRTIAAMGHVHTTLLIQFQILYVSIRLASTDFAHAVMDFAHAVMLSLCLRRHVHQTIETHETDNCNSLLRLAAGP